MNTFPGNEESMKLKAPARIMKMSTLLLISSVLDVSARVVRIETPNDYNYAYLDDYGVNIRGHNNISFLLRASNDGHVALSRYKYNWNTHSYEIVLGGWQNQRSAVRRCDQCAAKVAIDHEPLNASELLPFWISWDRGHIRVGSGRRLFEHQFLQWTDSDPETVNHVGFSTGWGSNGTWIIGAVDGGWSTWEPWSKCSTSCEGGTRTRKRACNDPLPAYGEDCVGDWLEESLCNDFPCAVDGAWSSWGEFGPCSVTCSDGFRSRFRSCDNPPPADGGDTCPGPGEDKEPCKDKECPVDGGWSEWTPWTSCSKECGTGEVTKRRRCDRPPPQYGGTRCQGKAIESRTCFVKECPIDGGWSEWSDWSVCSSTCSEGNISRSRDCNQPIAEHGGADCDGPGSEHLPCNTGSCPVSGSWSQWSVWEPCTLSCGNGSRSRIRFCDDPPPQFGGDDCAGADVATSTCNSFFCPVDGGWTSWGVWTPCTASCGAGTYSRTRRCADPTPTNGGARCRGSSFEEEDCIDIECPVDGLWSEWTSWSRCSHTCGPGHAQRSRECDSPEPQYGGFNCSGDWLELNECLVTYCPVDGGLTEWSPWSQCSATCGPGHMTKARWCIFPRPQYGGRPCEGETVNETTCMDDYCPIDGGWSSWGPWDTCTVTCEGGTRVRYRTCTSPPAQYGGRECEGVGLLNETCNIQLCPVPIGWAPWGTWTECSVTCGGGYMARTRQCEDPDVLNCIGSNVQNWTCAFVDCPDKWVYIAETEPIDAPGAVGIGVMAIVFMSLIPAICLIIDITSLPTHIRYARRNLRDFKKTVAEYRARRRGDKQVRYFPTRNNRPPAPSPVPQTSGTGNAVTGSGLSGSVSGEASSDVSTPGSPAGPPAYDNPGLEVHENEVGLKINQDGGGMLNHFDRISPILAASVGNHVGNDIQANHTPIIRDFDGPFDLGTPGMDRGTMTTY